MKMSNLLVLLAVLCLLGACKSSGRNEVMDKAETENVVSADSALITEHTTKLVKTGEMRFKVKDVQKSSEAISALTRSYKGMLMHHSMQSVMVDERTSPLHNDSLNHVSAFTTTATMTVKVPSENLDQFMNEVGRLGIYVNIRRMDIEDKTLDYLSAKLKHENRVQMEDEQKKWKPALKDANAMLKIKDDMVDGNISNRRVDEAVRYSTIDLSLYQSNTIVQEIIANDDTSLYQLPFTTRLSIALQNGWGLFASLVVALANLWVFVLVACAVWFAFRMYKRKALPVAGTI